VGFEPTDGTLEIKMLLENCGLVVPSKPLASPFVPVGSASSSVVSQFKFYREESNTSLCSGTVTHKLCQTFGRFLIADAFSLPSIESPSAVEILERRRRDLDFHSARLQFAFRSFPVDRLLLTRIVTCGSLPKRLHVPRRRFEPGFLSAQRFHSSSMARSFSSPAIFSIVNALIATGYRCGHQSHLARAEIAILQVKYDAAKSLDGRSADCWGRHCGVGHFASHTCRQAANSNGRIR
jgi:hypothetical protein